MTPVSPQDLRAALTAPFVPGEALDLRARRITGPLDLAGQVLCGFDLTGSVFEGPVSLAGATCRGLTWLRDCRFEDETDGQAAVFEHDLRFDGSQFRGALCLQDAEMRGTLVLDRAVLKGRAALDRMQVLSSFSCAGTSFEGPVALAGANCLGGLWADGAAFRSGVGAGGTEVHGRTWLRRAQFSQPAAADGGLTLEQQITAYGYVWT